MRARDDRTADTRRRIERAALKHFVEQGIAETSIRDIADEAGISLGAMYNHFKSKEELAWQLFVEIWDEVGAELRRRAQTEPNLPRQLGSMIEYIFRRFDEDRLRVIYFLKFRHQHLARVDLASRANPYTIFRTVIAEAMRRGEVAQGELNLKCTLIFGGILQAIDSRILGRLPEPLADFAGAAAELCVRMLGPGSERVEQLSPQNGP